MSNVYIALRPIYILTSLLGLTTFTITYSQKRITVKKINHFSIYKISFFVFIVLTVTFGILNNSKFLAIYKLTNTRSVMHIFKMYVTIVSLPFLAILTGNCYFKLSELCRALFEIDLKLKKNLDVMIDNRRIQIYTTRFIVLIICIFIGLYILEFLISETNMNAGDLVFVIFDLYKAAIELSFHIYITIIRIRFEVLNKTLRENPLKCIEDDICRIHLGLVKIAELTNIIFIR